MPTDDEQLQALGGSLAEVHRPKGHCPKSSLYNARRYWSGIAPYVKPGDSLLDIGCGDGSFLHLASQHGLRVLGVDVDPSAAAIAHHLYGLPVITGAVEDIARDQYQFDVITVAHTLEHIRNPRESLQTLAGRLKPDGILFVEVPNVMRPKVSYHRLFSLQHHYYFCPETLVALLARSGLKPVTIRCFCRDSFQVIATPDQCVDPQLIQGADWCKVVATIRRHRWVYKLSAQFIWRKIPLLKNTMYRVKYCRNLS